jgi:hypothetical protein
MLDRLALRQHFEHMNISGRFGEEGGGRPIEEGFVDGHGMPVDGTSAFFPIIQMRDSGPWTPIGTGFVISNNGLFATAKHVVLDEQGSSWMAWQASNF